MKNSLPSFCVAALIAAFALLLPQESFSQQFIGPIISHEAMRGETPLPLRDMKIIHSRRGVDADSLEAGEGRHPHLRDDSTGLPYDPVLQSDAPTTLNVTLGLNFDGVSFIDYATSDVNASVGSTQVVQYTNWDFSIYNKVTGAKIAGPLSEATLWTGFNGDCATSTNGDIIVLYDKHAGRWIFTHHDLNANGPFYQCIAVSETTDTTGKYYLYQYQLTNDFPDYPKLGVWADGYYLTTNLENETTYAFIASQVCALDRAEMLKGTTAAEVCFQTTQYESLLAADIDGKTLPPTGTPELLLSLSATGLDLFNFKVNWSDLAKSTFTGPTKISVAAFTPACGGTQCVPQLDTTQVLDSLADRLMYRLAYRNYGTYDNLTVTHSVTAGTSTGMRWYEIRSPRTGTPVVYQQGTYAPDSNYRWMGSIASDQSGDMALGYSISSATTHPGISFTGRLPTDTLGTMESEISIIVGGGSEQAPNYRWGDYSSMSIDPIDDCTFWYTNQYYKTDTQQDWYTRVQSFKFPGCK